MKTAIFPGSFNPFHEGHLEVLKKAFHIFDLIHVVQCVNPDKNTPAYNIMNLLQDFKIKIKYQSKIKLNIHSGLLSEYIKNHEINCIIKGIRNSIDFEYEKQNQCYNEDMGILCPTFYIISGRSVSHISSSAIRAIKSFEEKK